MEQKINKQINIGLNDGKQVVCEKCGGKYFMEVMMFWKFSALLTGQPKDSLMPIPVQLCCQCSTPLQELLPKELQNKPKINVGEPVIEG